MTAYQDVFKRYEKKYLLSPVQYRQFLMLAAPYMAIDQFGTHTIANLYYDTEDYALIRTSIEQPVYKEKLRVRSYGIPKAGDSVYVEIKKKYKGVVYKRRVQMAYEAANSYLSNDAALSNTSQIMQEIAWFKQRYEPVAKVFIAYERTAYYCKDCEPLRITFDQNIRFRESELDLSKGHYGKPILAPGQTLMEIKIPGVMPLWLSQILTRLKIFPTSFSKYGYCYKNYLIHHVYPQGGRQHA